MKKIIITIVLAILFIIAGFLIEECIRLEKNIGSKPAILINQTKCSPSCAEVGEEITLEYYGLGYKLKIRYYHDEDDSIRIIGEEFDLFYNHQIWMWIS